MFNVILLGITSFLTDISSEMIYPLIPLYLTTAIGATPAIIGLIEGIAESSGSLLKVFSGRLSDKARKRKPLTICGYSLSSLGKLMLSLSVSWAGVLLGRIADRFGKGIRTAPRDALIADSTDEKMRGKAYGLHRAMDTAGACIGVMLAYFFLISTKGNYKTIFMLSLIPAVLGITVLSFAREKTSPSAVPPAPHNFLKGWKQLDRRLKAFLIITLVFTIGNSSNMFILLRAKDLGFSPQNVILLYLVFNIIYSVFSYPAGVISDKVGRKPLIVSGYFVYGAVYLLLALINKPSLMWPLMGIYGLHLGFTKGVEKAFISDLAPVENRATFIGLHATLVGIGLLPASLLAGVLWNVFGAPAPFYLGAAMGVIASLGMILFI